MNFGAIKSYVREYGQTLFSFSKMSEGKQFNLSYGLLETFINEGYRLFCSYARTVKEQKYITTTALTTVYNLSAALTTNPSSNASTNLVEVIECFYESGDDKWRLRGVKDRERLFWETISYDSPQAFELQYGNKQIEVFPKVSNSAENIWIYGVWLPNDMTLDADEPQIPPNYHQALCNYAIFKIQMLIGALDETKQSVFSQFEKFEASFINLAEACKKETEYKNNDNFQMREDGEETEFYDDFYYPVFNHSPVISIIKIKDSIAFYDTTTSTTLFEVKSDGLYWYGEKMGFVKQVGKDTFNSTTGITIALGETYDSVEDYAVFIQALDSTDGDIGEIVVYKEVNQFTVKNTGSNATTDFNYIVTEATA